MVRKTYDVALSFAGEDRPYVEQVAARLQAVGVRVFYDDYEKVDLWGKDLYTHLDWVYRSASRYCVMFVSSSYAKKVWTSHERASAQARALEDNSEYVLPARFDETEIPGLRSTIGYLDISSMEPRELSDLIQKKLGPRHVEAGFPEDVGRLWKSLRLSGKKAAAKKKEARTVAYSLYSDLARMSVEERKTVVGVFAFGCGAELPGAVHISLDYLHRMTKVPKDQILESLKAVRTLHFKTLVRAPIHQPEDPDELVPDDQDLLISYWAPRAPACPNPTEVAAHAVHAAAHHFCEEHGLDVVASLDFHRLSLKDSGPVIFDDAE